MIKSKILIKNDICTNSDYGIEPTKRSISELLDKGFIVLDKDSGPNSHDLTDQVKKVLETTKTGHSGTLDPKVTGVLLIGLGRATRLMEYMLKSDKEYVCLLYLHKEVPKDKIKEVMKKFTGKIMQTPPIVSAVKREEREREIYSIKILDIKDNGQYVLFRVSCQHGTYIRKLCSDIGEYLGVGGQMIELRRTKAGPFTEDDESISLDNLRNLWDLYNESKGKEKDIFEKEIRKYVRPMEMLLKDFKTVYVKDTSIDSLCHGNDLAIPGVCKVERGILVGEEVAIFTLKGELVSMGTALLTSEDSMKKNKGIFVKTEKVFMDIGTYQKEVKQQQ